MGGMDDLEDFRKRLRAQSSLLSVDELDFRVTAAE